MQKRVGLDEVQVLVAEKRGVFDALCGRRHIGVEFECSLFQMGSQFKI